MRLLLCAVVLLGLARCATPSWDAPRGWSTLQRKGDTYQCEREAMAHSDERAREHQVKLGDRWFNEEFYGRCLEARGWTKGGPVGGCFGKKRSAE